MDPIKIPELYRYHENNSALGTSTMAVSQDNHGVLMLPADIMRKIFLNLPARQLCGLRTVCKWWCSLLSDAAFVNDYDARRKPLVAVAVTSGHLVQTLEFITVDMSTGNIVKRVPAGWRGKDRGRLHVHHHLAAIALDERCLRLRLVDLESGAVSIVPNRIEVEHPHDSRSNAYCAALVVGRATSGEHKVLRVRSYNYDQQFCHVLDLDGDCSNRQWREMQAPEIPIDGDSGNAAVVNGVAYFLVYRSRFSFRSARHDFDGLDGITSFDLAAEQWSPTLILGPLSSCCEGDNEDEKTFGDSDVVELAALSGCLVAVHVPFHGNVIHLWFYEGRCLEDGRSLWRRAYSIQFQRTSMQPLWVQDDGRLAMWDGRGLLRVYDPRSNEFHDVMVNINSWVSIGVYTGGMLSNY